MSHANVQTIDKGAATPIDFVREISTPISTNELPIAEFGLAVRLGTFNNFVTITGTVGIISGPIFTPSFDTIVLRIYRRNTIPPSDLVKVFELHQGLLGAGKPTLTTFSFTDGGADGPVVPIGYHAYTLSVHRQQGIVGDFIAPLDDPAPLIIGPIQFEGTSYTTNITP